MDKIILAIDTSSENLGVGIYNATSDEQWSFNEVAFRKQTAKLNVEIDDLLNESGYKFSDLSAIAVSKGPGSFTGIRIAMAAAKGFAMALDIPIIAVSNMDCLATNCEASDFTIWISAHGGDVYSQQFSNNVASNEIEAVKANEAVVNLKENSVICGSGAVQYSDILPKTINIIEPTYVNPVTLAKLAWENFSNNPEEAIDLTPLYIHKLHYKKSYVKN